MLWGSYFVPAQWAKVPAQVGNFPLALGIVVAGTALVMTKGGPARLSPRGTAVQLGAGLLFGIGNVSLLALVTRVGTGVGFTIAQLSLLVNVSVGIFVFKVPRPGSHAARVALIGIMLAGIGGVASGEPLMRESRASVQLAVDAFGARCERHHDQQAHDKHENEVRLPAHQRVDAEDLGHYQAGSGNVERGHRAATSSAR